MKRKEYTQTFLLGLILTVFMYISFFLLEMYLGIFIDYVYPLGYILLILCIVMFIPIIAGLIDVLYKNYVLEHESISLNLFYHGLFLMLLYRCFLTVFIYIPFYISIVLTFTIVPFVLGITSIKLLTKNE